MPKDRFEAENEGIDIIIDCTGVPAALEKAIQWTKMGATIIFTSRNGSNFLYG